MQTRFTNFAEIFVPESVGMSPKRSRLAYARLVPRLITSWRAVHRPRCSRSPPPRRASRPSRAPGPSARGACAARRWPAGTSGAPAATGSRCARRALGAVGPHRRHGRYAWIGFRSAAPSTSRAERSAERREERPPPSTREPRPPPVARRPPLSTSTARLRWRRGRLGVESGRVPGSMTSHFFEDGFFFSNRFCIPTNERDARESARERPRERLTQKHNAMSLDHEKTTGVSDESYDDAPPAALAGENFDPSAVFPRVKERDPYRRLGINAEASYEEVQDAHPRHAYRSHTPGGIYRSGVRPDHQDKLNTRKAKGLGNEKNKAKIQCIPPTRAARLGSCRTTRRS